MSLAGDAVDALHQVTSTLPAGGEDRPGQVEMLRAVAETIERVQERMNAIGFQR